MIIDSHVHLYPDSVYQNPSKWGYAKKETHWAELISSPLQGWPSSEKYLKDMHVAGISKIVLLGWYWQKQDTCTYHNRHILKYAQEVPNRFIPFVTVQPLSGIRVLDSLKKCLDMGAKGIGEIFPAAQGFAMDNRVWLKIVEFAIENNLPINMHVTEPLGHTYKGKVKMDLADYQWLVKTYPELKLILAHWGGLIPFYELNPEVKKDFKNVYYDTSASPLLYDMNIFQRVIDCIGSKRIIFGSDYPLRLFPKEQENPDFGTFITKINSLNLKESDLTNMFYNNIAKLLNIKEG